MMATTIVASAPMEYVGTKTVIDAGNHHREQRRTPVTRCADYCLIFTEQGSAETGYECTHQQNCDTRHHQARINLGKQQRCHRYRYGYVDQGDERTGENVGCFNRLHIILIWQYSSENRGYYPLAQDTSSSHPPYCHVFPSFTHVLLSTKAFAIRLLVDRAHWNFFTALCAFVTKAGQNANQRKDYG